MKRLVNHQTGISLRIIDQKFNVHRRIFQRELKDMGMHYRKNKRLLAIQKNKLKKLQTVLDAYIAHYWKMIIDDEKYLTLTNESISTNRGFYVSDSSVTPSEVKFKRTHQKSWLEQLCPKKAPQKLSVAKETQAINEITYLKQYIKDRLTPFINRYHNIEQVLFWPDLASSHYAAMMTKSFDEQNNNFVSREKIHRHVLLIITIWQILEETVYASSWEAKRVDQLKRRIQQQLRQIDMKSCFLL